MKVHFGSQLHVSFQEYSLEFSASQFDDTLPIDVQCPTDLSLDSISSQEDYDERAFQDGLWSEKKDSEEDIIDDSPLLIESYEDFMKGAQKRLHVDDQLDDAITSSPLPKKSRQDEVGGLFSSLDDSYENRPQVQDTLMFLKYRVMSFALNKHKNMLVREGNEANSTKENKARSTIHRFPHSSSNNAELFWNMCSSPVLCQETTKKGDPLEETSPMESDETELSPPVMSIGVTLAHSILKKEAEKENNCIPIKHSPSKNDFKSRYLYQKFLYEHKQNETVIRPLSLNQNMVPPKELDRPHPQMPTHEEINLYMMPELDEPVEDAYKDHGKERNLVSQQMENLQQQNESLGDHSPQLSNQVYGLERYNDESFNREQKFQRALALTQDDIDDESFYEDEERVSEKEVEEFERASPYQSDDLDEKFFDDDSANLKTLIVPEGYKQSDIDEIFLTQTQSSPHDIDSKNDSTNEFNVNHMLSELMASQAIMGTQQHQEQRYRYNMRVHENNYENVDDGVVPQFEGDTWSNDDVMFHEDRDENRKGNATKYAPRPHTPTIVESKKKSVFKWNNRDEDDSVVPCLGDLYNSPITTPQKLRLGLSKKLKVKRTLHPYRK